jgi:hypothetical protein
VTLGRQSHCRALLRCRGLVDETLRTEGAHLKTLEMSPTRLNPDGCRAGPVVAAVACADAPSTLQPLTPDRRGVTPPYGKKRKWMEKHSLL